MFCSTRKESHLLKILRNEIGVGADRGQATVEAAVLLPVFFLALLLLLQPAILLYDRVVMEGTATEVCRLLATKTDSLGSVDESCQKFVRHRLGAIPPLDIFHVHEPACSWNIALVGDECEQKVSVRIAHQVRPLPILNIAANALGLTDEEGNFEVSVACELPSYAPWVVGSVDALAPLTWIGEW